MDRTDPALSPLIEIEQPGWLNRAIRHVRTASRAKRARLFHSLFALGPESRVLDLGGGNGAYVHYLLADTPVAARNVFVADIDSDAVASAAATFGYRPVRLAEDGPLPFTDRHFDVVVCSSVLEHVTVPKEEIWRERSGGRFRERALVQQGRFAAELCRVARGYFVQVPYRGFPVETHTWLPFVGVMPRPVACRVIALANRAWIKRTIPDFYLPTAPEMRAFFPDGDLIRERCLGLTKSLIAVGGRLRRPPPAFC